RSRNCSRWVNDTVPSVDPAHDSRDSPRHREGWARFVMTARDESGCPWSWSRISLLNGAPAFSSPNPRRTATLSVEVERSCDAGEGERGPVVRVGERSRLRAGPAVPHGLEC